ncbi:MAG: pilus assembly protein N-terminal domain-containing protein, partial [Acidocella sp.]|nr:pilus assembly protein N-terminal domain-containing protein [Acidocella sp.]
MFLKRFIQPAGAVLAYCLATSLPYAAHAQDVGAQPPAPPAPAIPKPISGSLNLSMGSGRIVRLPHPVASIFAADPNVVEVRPASPTSLFMFGKGVGQTNVIATDGSGNTVAQYNVVVGPSSFASNRLAGQSKLSAPNSSVHAESEPGGMVVRGTVETPEQANQVMGQAKLISPSGTIANDLTVKEPIQVELKVRIAYMSRSVTRQLGIDWGSVGTSAFKLGKFALA